MLRGQSTKIAPWLYYMGLKTLLSQGAYTYYEKTAICKKQKRFVAVALTLLFYENDMSCRPEQNYLFIKAIQTFNKDADIQYKQLPGGHCHGSVHCDGNGEYDFVKENVRWLHNVWICYNDCQLKDMAEYAIQNLENEKGFFLMFEGAYIDKYCHNKIQS